MISDRLTLSFCVLTLVVAGASAVFHFSPGWIALPMIAAVISAMRTPVRSIIEMFFGGRR